MKYQRLAWIGIAAIYGIAFVGNVGCFTFSFSPKGLQIAASAIYSFTWICVLVFGHCKGRYLKVSMIVSALTTAGGMFGLLARALGSGLLTAVGLLTAGVFVTPLYGLLGLIKDYDLLYLVALIVGALWFAISYGLKRRV